MLPRSPGVYLITCVANSRLYVGSSVNVYRRWHAHHLPELRRRSHGNRHLQNAWNKYGEAAFTCGLLAAVSDTTMLVAREQHWIDHYDAANPKRGFNLVPRAYSTLGCTLSDDHKRQIQLRNSRSYIVRDPSGNEQLIHGLLAFCREHGLTPAGMHSVRRGNANHHKKWECRSAGQSREEWLKTVTRGPQRAVMVRSGLHRCSGCRDYLPRGVFSADATTRRGFSAYCKDCISQRRRAAYAAKRKRQTREGAALATRPA